jgi:NAD(P)-dependent dehydrogenase (short-subunit alcohol dehydrogenase family)
MEKNVLLLGGSSEIGLEIIKIFLKKNWQVHAHYNKKNTDLKKIQSKNKMLHLYKSNFANMNNVKKFIRQIANKDICSVINLVGFIDNINYQKHEIKSLVKSLTINTLVPLQIQKSLLKYMIRINFGRILNVSSIGVKYGGGEYTYNYAFSKHALEFVPSHLRKLASKNILTNVLRVGVVNTKLQKKIKGKNIKKRIQMIPIKRSASKYEISKTVFYLSSEKNTYITNEKITIAGGE